MRESRVRIVPASEDDVLTFARTRCGNEHDARLYLDLAAQASSGAWVAKDDETPIAIAFGYASDGEVQLCELFVEPSFRGSGIARALFERVFEDDGDARAALQFEPSATGAVALCARAGIAAHAPVFRVAGAIPREEDLARLAAGEYRFGAGPIDLATHGFAVDGLDREVRGTSRRALHAMLAERASGIAFTLNNELVGYAYIWPSGRIGPFAAASTAFVEQFFGFALVSLTRTYGASWCTALIPGANVRALRAMRRAALRVEHVSIFASRAFSGDFSRYLGCHALAF